MRGRIPALEAMRGLAALMVVAAHVNTFHSFDDVPQAGWLNFTSYGWLGVQLFFVLSGLVLYLPYARGTRLELGRYATRRILRIGPGLWVALAITVAAFGLWTPEALRHALFLNPNTDTAASPIAPAWSLTIEMGFYLLLPALVWLFARRQSYRIPILFALILVGFAFRQRYQMGWPMNPLTYVDNFAAGMLAAIVVARYRLPRWTLVVGAVALVAGLAYMGVKSNWVIGIAVVGLLFAVTLATLASVDPHVPRALIWLGTISYGVYLWHWPILRAVHDQGLYRLPDALEVAAVAGASVVAGWVSWRIVEQPAVRLSSRRRTRRAQAAHQSPSEMEASTGGPLVSVVEPLSSPR